MTKVIREDFAEHFFLAEPSANVSRKAFCHQSSPRTLRGDFLKKNTPRRASAEHAEQVKLAANRFAEHTELLRTDNESSLANGLCQD